MDKRRDCCIVIIYDDPVRYPPTLNATKILSNSYRKVFLIGRKFVFNDWIFPDNVQYVFPQDLVQNSNIETSFLKMYEYVGFLKLIMSVFRQNEISLVLTYDTIGAFMYYLSKSILSKSTTNSVLWWHHSHDVYEGKKPRVLTTIYWSLYLEKYFFNDIKIFSLPALERLRYYPLTDFHGMILHIPNYPSLDAKRTMENVRKRDGFRIIYQGSLGVCHGFERIIESLNQLNIDLNINLYLDMIGPINPDYKMRLKNLAYEEGAAEFIKFYDPVSYDKLADYTAGSHIGLATHIPQNIIYSTGATASNKIYEYMSYGLPVILYDDKHYRDYLEHYKWTFFTDLSYESLKQVIIQILNDYDEISESALSDFNQELNYDLVFGSSYQDVEALLK